MSQRFQIQGEWYELASYGEKYSDGSRQATVRRVGVTDYHNPKKCALCQDLGFQLVKEPYAMPIRVDDYSHRLQRINVKRATQEVLPF